MKYRLITIWGFLFILAIAIGVISSIFSLGPILFYSGVYFAAALVFLICPTCILDARIQRKEKEQKTSSLEQPSREPENLELKRAELEQKKQQLLEEREKLKTEQGEIRFCKFCGEKLSSGTTECPYCGSKLT